MKFQIHFKIICNLCNVNDANIGNTRCKNIKSAYV